MNGFQAIAWTTTIIFFAITLTGNGPSTYRFAIFFLAPFLWSIYWVRHRLHLHPFHFGLLAAAFILHNLGAYGFYKQKFAGIEFDAYVHYYFGVAGGFIVARALWKEFGFTGWKLWVGAILLILGIGGIHELIEYASTLVLGPEKGMLKINDPDKFDTQKDLLNNLLGTLTALLLYTVAGKRARTKTSYS
ncbi:MAG: DUF2238 domain-containing protein [Verrucomicrobiota bacterium]|nr:DUF2238 domain-containing protein [Verrucomicrobiota bacterium]